MKQIHFQIKDDHSTFISYLCNKLAFLVIFLSVMQKITTAKIDLRSVKHSGNETDRVALLAIKSQLVEDLDMVLSSWNDTIHHCSWEGVTCGPKHNRVTVLDLSSRGLGGTISPSIGNLSFLQIIRLDNNSLNGEIPNQVSQLFELHELRLNNNTLGGEIPANISGCVNLRFISLGYNSLKGTLPVRLGALSELEELRVHHNYLQGPLFDILQNLTSLVEISAGYNLFSGTVPNDISRMQNLRIIGVAENKLTGTFPTSLFNISSLQILDFLRNQLYGELPAHISYAIPHLNWLNLVGNNFSGSIPIRIQNLTMLEMIGLGGNSFTGRVPHDFGNFQNLTILNLADNYLSGNISFISTLANCSKLKNLVLGPNNFFGTLPESFANLSTSLAWLIIEDTPIAGTIPAGITNLVNLVTLDMSNCKLSGAVPHDLGKLRLLESIYLNSNRLSGNLPNSLGNLPHLSSLHLQNNILEGRIPPQLGNCKSLLYLNLSSNALNETLGKELFDGSAKFVDLDLSHNQLEGSLPLEISNQTSLEKLRISMNKFSGEMPDGLGVCSGLQYLNMDGNSFHGDIPSSYAFLAGLQEIDFSRNNLSGQIPAFFSTFPTVYYLNLSYNNFEGRVPTNSVFANASAVFVAGNNRLCGGIKQLHLPKCIEHKILRKKKTIVSRALKLTIPIISSLVGVVAIAAGLYLACVKKKKTPLLSGSMMGKVTRKVSYDMLLKATAGFSSKNLLGMGSFGSVFKGILDGKTVAVKVLNLQHHGASKSFMAECNTLKNIRHRNLVGIITACSSIDFQRNDFKALIHEYMPNGSLEKWLHGVDGNMSLAQRVGVAIDVAHALNYLHHECETPIVHCDLKPSNILLDNDMVAHVGDFGLARFLTQPRHPNQSSTTGIRGTIGYSAPEYGLGNEASTDGDLYSYGILLLELTTGKRPTDRMFKEDYHLHTYANEALPDQVLQIVDPKLVDSNVTDKRREVQEALQRKLECIVSMVSVGVACSDPLPQKRLKITIAISRLRAARDKLLSA